MPLKSDSLYVLPSLPGSVKSGAVSPTFNCFAPPAKSELPPIAPEKVLDAIERDLEKGRLMVYPTGMSRLGVQTRRWLPGLLWSGSHRTEGFE